MKFRIINYEYFKPFDKITPAMKSKLVPAVLILDINLVPEKFVLYIS